MFQKIKMVKYRNIAESLFNLKCCIYEAKEVKEDYVTDYEWVKAAEDIPCRRSYDAGSGLNYNKTGDKTIDYLSEKQYVRIFMPYGTSVKPGSRIELSNGECYEYSGVSLEYDTHIEIYASNVKRWA